MSIVLIVPPTESEVLPLVLIRFAVPSTLILVDAVRFRSTVKVLGATPPLIENPTANAVNVNPDVVVLIVVVIRVTTWFNVGTSVGCTAGAALTMGVVFALNTVPVGVVCNVNACDFTITSVGFDPAATFMILLPPTSRELKSLGLPRNPVTLSRWLKTCCSQNCVYTRNSSTVRPLICGFPRLCTAIVITKKCLRWPHERRES